MPAKAKVEVDNSANEELACTYAALILHDDKIADDKIKAILAAAKFTVKPYLPGIFARVATAQGLDDLILKGGASAAAAPAAAGAAPAAAAKEEKKEEKKAEKKVVEEKKEESDEDMGFGLFD